MLLLSIKQMFRSEHFLCSNDFYELTFFAFCEKLSPLVTIPDTAIAEFDELAVTAKSRIESEIRSSDWPEAK